MIDEQKLMWARLKGTDKQFLFDNLSSAMLDALAKAGKHKLAYDNAVIDFVKSCMKFFSVEEISNALLEIPKTLKNLEVNWGRLCKEVHPNFTLEYYKMYQVSSNGIGRSVNLATIKRFYKPKGKAYSNKYYEVFRQKV